MSYILDALKKIEHEKIKKTVPGGTSRISGGLFNERKSQSSIGGGRKIIAILVLIVLASVATFGITWFALHGGVTKKVATATTVVVPVSPQPVPKKRQPVSSPVVATPAASLEVKSPLVTVAEKGRGAATTKKGVSAATGAPKVLKPAGQSIPPPADIKVSGIAWQDEHEARRAVVNGFLLKEGALVSGAKISDIMADRVRFTTAAGVFELRLDASSPGDQKR